MQAKKTRNEIQYLEAEHWIDLELHNWNPKHCQAGKKASSVFRCSVWIVQYKNDKWCVLMYDLYGALFLSRVQRLQDW